MGVVIKNAGAPPSPIWKGERQREKCDIPAAGLILFALRLKSILLWRIAWIGVAVLRLLADRYFHMNRKKRLNGLKMHRSLSLWGKRDGSDWGSGKLARARARGKRKKKSKAQVAWVEGNM